MGDELIIREASNLDLNIIAGLAEKTWWLAYSTYLSDEQIKLMLADLYNPRALMMQMDLGIHFSLAEFDSKPVGFVAFGPKAINPTIYRIEKLYILPEVQRTGLGEKLIHHVEHIAKERKSYFLELNVNRSNPALAFYKRMGFSIAEKVDIPYHRFVLNDYIMTKRIEYIRK